jgi:hypothetical protein
MSSVVTFNAKAFERSTVEAVAPSVIPCGRRVFTRAQWDAMKAIPYLKSDDKRAHNAAQQTVAFGRRRFTDGAQ